MKHVCPTTQPERNECCGVNGFISSHPQWSPYNVWDLDDDYVINSTYANLNQLLSEDKQKDYQFELCEKPVIKLPEQYKNKSVVIMDGPFMCIDPLGDSDLHVMGNVVHAIHSTNVGKFPEYDKKFDDLLNKGIVKNPSITNIDKFIEAMLTIAA